MAAATKLSLKLLIDTKIQKVMFAEADNKTVDFLFYILSLPIGTIIWLLNSKQTMAGCLANLYKSIENISETYIQPNQTKHTLLNPRAPPAAVASIPLLSLIVSEPTNSKAFYRCSNNYYCVYVAENPRAVCPQCRSSMSSKMTYVDYPPVEKTNKEDNEGGFVKGVVTYMVMDDLEVRPMSTISCIALLNKFNVKEIGVLEEKEVDLGMDEALNLLKTSLESKTVLTDVFLKKMEK